jgi:tetratricopeptide (TPR) repeat protein
VTLAVLLTLSVLQSSVCAAENAALAAAAARAAGFDLEGAVSRLNGESLRGCARAEMAVVYLRGLIAARQAYDRGGDPASLGPVREAIARLDAYAKAGSRPAEMAGLVLRAAASAAQSERDEMGVFLQHVLEMEALQLEAGAPGAPVATAHETAGDLWLQVHQYDRARDAYRRALERLGPRPRLTFGLGRAAARLKETARACAEYQRLFEDWHWAPKGPAEVDEARLFKQQQCEPRRPR